MKKLILVAVLLVATTASAQVARKIIVEHFTNTVCGVCALRNPGFYANLENYPDVLHLAIHPSSPYASCLLNQNNVAENDARTNYYGVYGSTPRLVIQGQVIPSSADYSDAALFEPFENQTTPISLTIWQTKFGNDSMRVTYVAKTVAPNTLGTLVLFAALAEDTVFYNSPNGETLHHDVYRKSLAGVASQITVIPAAVGDSVSYTVNFHTDFDWDYARLFAVGVLQDSSTKAVE
ncbi:MAG TPA: hypothetical protein VEY71_07480, partial [Chitinophagales bacterium]|nr:hypothetical protein [Chitinophagales bacterium]